MSFFIVAGDFENSDQIPAMNNPRKRLRELISGVVKDRASLIKANLTTPRAASSIRAAIIRATTHAAASPPPDHRIAAVIDLGKRSFPVISAVVAAIVARLRRTRDPFVALKCLFLLHNLIVKDRIFFSSSNGYNPLNLSDFSSKSRELSDWVRWYASVIEHNVASIKVLGSCYISNSSRKSINFDKIKIPDRDSPVPEYEVVGKMESLVSMVENLCRAPESWHWRKNDVVHEVMVLVEEDYRSAQYQILIRLGELVRVDRVKKMSYVELTELVSCLGRLEQCRGRMNELFIRRRSEGFWEAVRRSRAEIEAVKGEWERQSMVLWSGVRT